MIHFTCPLCAARIKAPADKAGQASACPRCRRPIHIPVPAPAEPPLAETEPPPVFEADGLQIAESPLGAGMKVALLIVRFLGWAACLAWATVLVARYSRWAEEVSSAAEHAALATHTLVWLACAYFVARCVDSLSREPD